MTILFMDGFSHYATADITKKWSGITSSPVITSNGRRGAGCLQNATGTSGLQGFANRALPSSIATGGVGFALYVNDLPGGDSQGTFLRFVDTSTVHVLIGVDSAGALVAYRASSSNVLGRSAGGLVSTGAWNHVEAKVTINDSTGAVTVKLNGVAVLTLTSVDTRNAGNSTYNLFGIGQFATSGSHLRFCDLVAWDTSGSTNNDFLGDLRIDSLYPNADGNYSQFTPSTGTDHYALVDETTPNTTDYNDGSAVGDRDSYALGNLAALTSQTVYAVQVNAAMNKDDAGAKSASTFVRSGGSNSDGASTVLGTSQAYVSQVYETDPASAAWTESTVNGMEAGVRVTA